MLCKICGRQVSEADSFCANCGTPLTGSQNSAEPVEPATSVEPAVPVEPAKPAEPVEPREKPEASNTADTGSARRTPKPKKIKYRKERPPMALRAFMQIGCFFLCLIMVVMLLASVLVLDLRRLTSADGLEVLINGIFSGAGLSDSADLPTKSPVAPQYIAGYQATPLSDYDIDVNDIPPDVITGFDQEDMDTLVDVIYEAIQEELEEELPFTVDELQEFMKESNASEFVSEKMAGFAQDFINGTENTTITSDELMGLLEENEQLLEEKLNISLTEETKTSIRNELEQVVDVENLSGTIRDSVNEAMEESLQGSLGVDLATIRDLLQQVITAKALWTLLGICLVILALLCALNYYNLGAGFTWASAAGILVGWLVCLPLNAVDILLETLVEVDPEMAGMMISMDTFFAPIAPIHYGLLYGSLAVFVLSIVWRIVARVINSNRPYA